VRPTSDRVRESIFNLLGPRVAGADVLDLFAGTGALGLEALSRGAASAVLVESDPVALAIIRQNVELLGAEGSELLPMDYRRALRRLAARGRRFGLVFLDPPYGTGMAARAAAETAASGVAEAGTTVVVEDAARSPVPDAPHGWRLAGERVYGDTRVTMFEISTKEPR
jgi:16S rRNA (guanine966-N2)-methyltransferase